MQSDINKRLELADLLQGLSDRQHAAFPDEESKQTTIRIAPDVRKFCEDMAKEMGISLSSFVGSVLTAVMLETTNPVKWQLILAHKRFISVFKAHGYSYRDMTKELERFGICPGDLSNCLALMDKLNRNDEIYDYVADKFKVSKKWLKGIENRREVQNAE
jgi:antitoxin component of RelBE/YafQ-DinJ toxin-antitoxin module